MLFGQTIDFQMLLDEKHDFTNIGFLALQLNNYIPKLEEIIYIKKKFYRSKFVAHGSMISNLSAPEEYKRKFSISSLVQEILIFSQLKVESIVIHPGSTRNLISFEKGIDNLIDSLSFVLDELSGTLPMWLLIENMVSNGGKLLSNLEQVNYFFEKLSNISLFDGVPIGLCLDTCHLFASGYNINDINIINSINSKISGLNLKLVHLNDSKFSLGLQKDRHENITKGFLKEFFEKGYLHLLNCQDMVLETPFSDIISCENELSFLRSTPLKNVV